MSICGTKATEETEGDGTCGEDHNWTLLDSVDPTCLTLGYDRYLCVDCGKIESGTMSRLAMLIKASSSGMHL